VLVFVGAQHAAPHFGQVSPAPGTVIPNGVRNLSSIAPRLDRRSARALNASLSRQLAIVTVAVCSIDLQRILSPPPHSGSASARTLAERSALGVGKIRNWMGHVGLQWRLRCHGENKRPARRRNHNNSPGPESSSSVRERRRAPHGKTVTGLSDPLLLVQRRHSEPSAEK
jgi:hypothetical protein